MYEKLWSLRKQLQHSHNLIHCITNPISMNDCANAVLALGAKPIMAQHPMECEQITACSKALALNLGNFDDSRAIAMKKSLHCANENGIPVIVDMVGAGCSDLREAFAEKLLHEGKFSIIKGNLSELKAVSGRDSHALGIDVGDDDREAPAKSACTQIWYYCLVQWRGGHSNGWKADIFCRERGFHDDALYRNRLYAECDSSSIFIRYRDCA